jgi:general stress protein YciG
MSGTSAGGRKAAIKNRALYGRDFYRHIGRKGGMISRGGGFTDKALAARAGRKGGTISRRQRDQDF